MDEIRTVLDRLGEAPYSAAREAEPVATEVGYAAWAASYDAPGNVTVALEEEIVHALLAELPTGSSVLDAGCGTGRHTAFLAGNGHEVVGIDSSSEMLALAAVKVPTARLELAELERIPLPDDSVDAVVCGLVLSHARDIRTRRDRARSRPSPRRQAHRLESTSVRHRDPRLACNGDRRRRPALGHSRVPTCAQRVRPSVHLRRAPDRGLSRAVAHARAGARRGESGAGRGVRARPDRVPGRDRLGSRSLPVDARDEPREQDSLPGPRGGRPFGVLARGTLRGSARTGRHVLSGRQGRLKLREISHHFAGWRGVCRARS